MMLGENTKAGMDSIEFTKYIFTTILALLPDASYTPGKCVAIIVNSGPGRVNSSILAQLRICRFYLIPGVTKTTHATQSIDRNYELFKSAYQDNLVKLTQYRVRNKSDKNTIQKNDITLLIFGGISQKNGLKNVFEDSFEFEKYQDLS